MRPHSYRDPKWFEIFDPQPQYYLRSEMSLYLGFLAAILDTKSKVFDPESPWGFISILLCFIST